MPSRDVAERKTVVIHTRVQCALLCNVERFEMTVMDITVLCHMAMGNVDASPLDAD